MGKKVQCVKLTQTPVKKDPEVDKIRGFLDAIKAFNGKKKVKSKKNNPDDEKPEKTPYDSFLQILKPIDPMDVPRCWKVPSYFTNRNRLKAPKQPRDTRPQPPASQEENTTTVTEKAESASSSIESDVNFFL